MAAADQEVSVLRLYLLRAMYLLIVVGLGVVVWPGIISHAKPWTLNGGVVNCMLAAFSLLSLLGIVAYPAWVAGTIDEPTAATAVECMVAILIPIVLPWGYVIKYYVRQPGARWR
jgi:hypothetical protein